jgi:transcriptional regulator with XRE-family HTH domain
MTDLELTQHSESTHKSDGKVKVTGRRVGWSTLSDNEKKLPGAALLVRLCKAANSQNLQLNELAKELGITYDYFAQLRRGSKSVPNISDEFADRCAKFLRLPKITILVEAGKISISDFYEPINTELLLDQAIRAILEDPHYAGFAPLDLLECNDTCKTFIVKLYENATGKILLPGKVIAANFMVSEGCNAV